MKKTEISYILAILNAERTLRDCLNGIFMQKSSKKYEVLIIDGGSTDSTLDIIKEYMTRQDNILLMNNPYKLSEGKGMGKDQGVTKARGDILIFLDHDNIITDENWLEKILAPFSDKNVMASQSLLHYREDDTNFLKYVNALGVEDPFAAPYSLVSQVVLNPSRFASDGDNYFHRLNEKSVLFGGANGCAFRKETFNIIGGYTRDVDIFQGMAEHKMLVAVPRRASLHHKTSNDFLSFLKKKGLYFFRFINNDYGWKKFKWAGNSFSGNLRFFLSVMRNLSIIGNMPVSIRQVAKKGELFWMLHPFYVFFMTLEYGAITMLKFRNFTSYISK